MRGILLTTAAASSSLRGLGRCGLIASAFAAAIIASSSAPAQTPPSSVCDAPPTIYFDCDRYDLRPDAINAMKEAVNFLREHPSFRVIAEGHADERGTSAYNNGLGELRARAVRDYLVSSAISADRIQTVSYGKECPVSTNCGGYEECRANNRRVEWRILSSKGSTLCADLY